MREIKFRAWDNQENVYLNKKDIAIDNLGNVFVLEGHDDNDIALYHARILINPGNEQYVVERFTGLKDINGAEIFEGDIIIQKSLGSNKSGCRGKITYKEDHAAFMFEVYERGKPVMCLFLNEFNPEKTCEVIGNIHENPELLEEK